MRPRHSETQPRGDTRDPLFEQAADVVIQNEGSSTSLLQRRLRIGYGRAVILIDQLHAAGVLGPPDGSKPRVLMSSVDQLRQLYPSFPAPLSANDQKAKLVQAHFTALAEARHLSGALGAIVTTLAQPDLTPARRRAILKESGLLYDKSHRSAELDLLLGFVVAALRNPANFGFSLAHQLAFSDLKSFFEVHEGEFLKCRPVELSTLLEEQLDLILEDNIIDPAEDEHQVALQVAFGLAYDQYLYLVRRNLEQARLRLEDALARERRTDVVVTLRAQLNALDPIVRLAELQRRSLGALF